jgi:hypothetical protein
MVEGHPCRIGGFHARIVVPGHVQEGNVEAGDQVLEVVEWKVAAGDYEVWPERLKLVPVQKVVYFVRDRKDPQARTSFLVDSRATSAARAASKPSARPWVRMRAISEAE